MIKPSINNLTIDLWYWGIARYVWISTSDFCSNELDLKHSVSIVKEYLQEAPKLANNEMMIYNGQNASSWLSHILSCNLKVYSLITNTCTYVHCFVVFNA